MQKTYMAKKADVKRNWHLVDASDKVVGRFASELARKLMGKHKPEYTPHIDCGDYIVVINAAKIVATGTKAKNKTYFSYSGYQSGLQKKSMGEVMLTEPERVIRDAVYRMLPDNKLRSERMTRLKIYAGTEHAHESQFKAEN